MYKKDSWTLNSFDFKKGILASYYNTVSIFFVLLKEKEKKIILETQFGKHMDIQNRSGQSLLNLYCYEERAQWSH